MSRFANLRKTKNETNKTSYCRHLVVGDDLFSVAKFNQLQKEFGDEVGLVCENTINRKSIIRRGPSMLRGPDNIALVRNLFPDLPLIIEGEGESAVFFKDKEWRKFGGRTKPESFLHLEEFFVKTKAEFDDQDLFPFLGDEAYLAELEQKRFQGKMSHLYRLEAPFDLVEPAHYGVHLSNGQNIECEKLYYARGPLHFLKSFKDPGQLSDQMVEFCEGTAGPSTLTICFKLNKPLSDMKETMFIPLSYTHEWGHLIGEFKKESKAGDEDHQWAEFLCFIDPEQASEQEIVKKVHYLKRQMEKIFPPFNDFLTDEYIRFDERSLCLKIDDKQFANISKEYENISFISTSAPLSSFDEKVSSYEYSNCEVVLLARSMATL